MRYSALAFLSFAVLISLLMLVRVFGCFVHWEVYAIIYFQEMIPSRSRSMYYGLVEMIDYGSFLTYKDYVFQEDFLT